MALTSEALVTLAQIKSFAGIEGTHNDTRLELNIEAASQRIINYLGYDPHTQSYTEEYHAGNGTKRIWTNARPITAVSAVTVDDSTISSDSYDSRTNYIEFETYAPAFGVEILVSYTAGYATIPHDIQMACLQIAAFFEAKQDATGLNGLSSRSNDTTSRTIRDNFIDDVLGDIEDHKREMM